MTLRIETFEEKIHIEFAPLLVIIYFQLYNFLLKKKHANQIIFIFIVIVFKNDQESKRFADYKKGNSFEGIKSELKNKGLSLHLFYLLKPRQKNPVITYSRHINLDVILK